MAKKKKQHRRSYLNDFKLNAAGRYEYFGNYYKWDNHSRSRRSALTLSWSAILACCVLTVVSGCNTAAGMTNTFYVILPFVAEVASLFSVVWGACRLTFGGEPLREYVYRETVPKLPMRSLLVAISACVGSVGSVVYIALNGFEGRPFLSVAYPVSKLAVAVLAIWLRCVWREFSYRCDNVRSEPTE